MFVWQENETSRKRGKQEVAQILRISWDKRMASVQ